MEDPPASQKLRESLRILTLCLARMQKITSSATALRACQESLRKADRLGLVDARPVVGRIAAEGHVQVLEERVEALADGQRRGRVRLQRKAPLMHMI